MNERRIVDKKVDSISRASMIQLGAKMITVVAQLGFTAVLARILTPDEYGVVAVIMVFTGFFTILADFGISTAVVQFVDLTNEEHDALFFVSFVMAGILSVLFVLVSCLVAIVYQNPIYMPLGLVLIPSIAFNTLNMVPNGILIRDKRFASIGLRLVFSTIASGAITVVLAWAGLGVFAIVLNSVLSSLFIFVWNEWHVRLRPKVKGSLTVLRKVGKYSAFRFGDQTIVYFASNLDSLLCGKFFGAQALGYYNKAYALAGMPNTYLISTITSTLHPFFTEYKNDPDALWSRLNRVVKTVSILGVFCCIQMFACSRELVVILFGDQWMPAIPLLQILAFWIYPRSVNGVHAPMLLGMDRSDLLFLSTSINTAITAVMICFGVFLGSVETMAICVTVAYFLELIVPVYLCVKVCLKKSIAKYLVRFLPELIMGTICLLVVSFIPAVDNVLLGLFAKFGLISLLYLALCFVFRQWRYLQEILLSLKK